MLDSRNMFGCSTGGLLEELPGYQHLTDHWRWPQQLPQRRLAGGSDACGVASSISLQTPRSRAGSRGGSARQSDAAQELRVLTGGGQRWVLCARD